MNHELKIWPEYFGAVRSGLKTFEIRKNDRGFQVGDTLLLREYNANSEEFSGQSITRLITYIVEGPPFMAEGWAVLGMVNEEDTGGPFDLIMAQGFQTGYRHGYKNGCDDTGKLLMGTGIGQPVGIMTMLQEQIEESGTAQGIRMARMIHADPERTKEPGQ